MKSNMECKFNCLKKESPDPELETTIPGTSTNPETSSSGPFSHGKFCFEDSRPGTSSPEPSHLEYFNIGGPNPDESRDEASSPKVSHSRSLLEEYYPGSSGLEYGKSGPEKCIFLFVAFL